MSRAVSHHPDHHWLERYAAGSLPLPLALCIGAHATLCAGCRRELANLQRLGGALLADLAPSPVPASLRERVFAAIAQTPPPHQPAPSSEDVPAPLRRWVPEGYDRLRWSPALPGLRRVALPEEDGCRAALLRMAAGGSVPAHDHRGPEMTVLLRGGYADRFGRYDAGDLVVREPGETHFPRATGDGECICLIAQAGPVHFTGRFWRLLNPLLR